MAEFASLNRTQNTQAANGRWGALSANANWYWTTDKSTVITNQHYAFSPFNPVPQGQAYADTTHVGVWAVATVPEPQTYAMLLAGLGVLSALALHRNRGRSASQGEKASITRKL